MAEYSDLQITEITGFKSIKGLTGQGLYVYSLAINSNGDIFAGTDDGIFRSTDNGDNWVQINQGLTN